MRRALKLNGRFSPFPDQSEKPKQPTAHLIVHDSKRGTAYRNSSGGYHYFGATGSLQGSSSSTTGGGYQSYNGQGGYQGVSYPVNGGAIYQGR